MTLDIKKEQERLKANNKLLKEYNNLTFLLAYNKFRDLSVEEAYLAFSTIIKNFKKNTYGLFLKAADEVYGIENGAHASRGFYRIANVYYKGKDGTYYKPLFYGTYYGPRVQKPNTPQRNDYRKQVAYNTFIDLIDGNKGQHLIVDKLIEKTNYANFNVINGKMVAKLNRSEINKQDIKVLDLRSQEINRDAFEFYYERNMEHFKKYFDLVNELRFDEELNRLTTIINKHTDKTSQLVENAKQEALQPNEQEKSKDDDQDTGKVLLLK